jgi:hypothetical protein
MASRASGFKDVYEQSLRSDNLKPMSSIDEQKKSRLGKEVFGSRAEMVAWP